MSTEIKFNELPDLNLKNLFSPSSLSENDIQEMVGTLKSGKVMDQLGELLEGLPAQSQFLLEKIQANPDPEALEKLAQPLNETLPE